VVDQITGVHFNLSQPNKDNIEEAISGVRSKVVLEVCGSDLDAMRKSLEEARDEISKIE
jgi:cobalt-zinc-cadmium resistance protein CzcA